MLTFINTAKWDTNKGIPWRRASLLVAYIQYICLYCADWAKRDQCPRGKWHYECWNETKVSLTKYTTSDLFISPYLSIYYLYSHVEWNASVGLLRSCKITCWGVLPQMSSVTHLKTFNWKTKERRKKCHCAASHQRWTETSHNRHIAMSTRFFQWSAYSEVMIMAMLVSGGDAVWPPERAVYPPSCVNLPVRSAWPLKRE